jgi:flagellar motor switch protein FliM
VPLAPADAVVVVIGFELAIGASRGAMSLCIPYVSIGPLAGKLSAANWLSCGRQGVSPETLRQLGETICSSPVGVDVRLAQTGIGTGELVSLRVGDIITTQKDIHQPVIVSVEGVPKFRAKVGTFKGHKAIMIHSAIENPIDALGE